MLKGKDVEITADEPSVPSLNHQQQSWLEKFNTIADSNDEEVFFNLANDFDSEEWR